MITSHTCVQIKNQKINYWPVIATVVAKVIALGWWLIKHTALLYK